MCYWVQQTNYFNVLGGPLIRTISIVVSVICVGPSMQYFAHDFLVHDGADFISHRIISIYLKANIAESSHSVSLIQILVVI